MQVQSLSHELELLQTEKHRLQEQAMEYEARMSALNIPKMKEEWEK